MLVSSSDLDIVTPTQPLTTTRQLQSITSSTKSEAIETKSLTDEQTSTTVGLSTSNITVQSSCDSWLLIVILVIVIACLVCIIITLATLAYCCIQCTRKKHKQRGSPTNDRSVKVTLEMPTKVDICSNVTTPPATLSLI